MAKPLTGWELQTKAAGAAFLWTALTVFFALIQLWFVLVLSSLMKEASFSLEDWMNEGALLFLVSAVIATIVIDYYFGPKLRFSKRVEGVLFICYPLCMSLLVALVYSGLRLATPFDLDYDKCVRWQRGLLVFAVIYAVVIKHLTFIKNFKT